MKNEAHISPFYIQYLASVPAGWHFSHALVMHAARVHDFAWRLLADIQGIPVTFLTSRATVGTSHAYSLEGSALEAQFTCSQQVLKLKATFSTVLELSQRNRRCVKKQWL